MEKADGRAGRDHVARSEHREHVSAAARRVMEAHAEALERLGR